MDSWTSQWPGSWRQVATVLPCQFSGLNVSISSSLILGAPQAVASLCPVLISNVEKHWGPLHFQNRPECAIVSGQWEPLEGPMRPVKLEALAVYLQRTSSRKAPSLRTLDCWVRHRALGSSTLVSQPTQGKLGPYRSSMGTDPRCPASPSFTWAFVSSCSLENVTR